MENSLSEEKLPEVCMGICDGEGIHGSISMCSKFTQEPELFIRWCRLDDDLFSVFLILLKCSSERGSF